MTTTSTSYNSDLTFLIKEAKQILQDNWTGNSTRPSQSLYPYQWSWDSAFIAIGYASYDQNKAMTELKSLFDGMWSNGFLPHIVFNADVDVTAHFPGPDWWQSSVSPYAPKYPETSGIIDPPVHATAVRRIVEFGDVDSIEIKTFLKEVFPKLELWHHFLWNERVFDRDTPLLYIRHMWESGRDNDPNWDAILQRINIQPNELPSYTRTDNCKYPTDRPSQFFYDRAIYLLLQGRKNFYDENALRSISPFMVEDVMFNAIWVRANFDMAYLATLLGKDPSIYEDYARATSRAMTKKLYVADKGYYFNFDLVSNTHIQDVMISSSALPLYGGIETEKQAKSIAKMLESKHFQSDYSVASLDLLSPYFSNVLYWRGPTWININWMLVQGLQERGFVDQAQKVVNSTFKLIQKNGFWECFDPISGNPYGSDKFSWSASLFLDLFLSPKRFTKQ